MDDDDASGFLGCLWAILGLGAAVGAVVVLANVDWAAFRETLAPNTPSPNSSSGSSRSTPLTHVGPVSEKQVVEKAANMDPLARKIRTEDDPLPDSPPPTAGVVALVENLGTVAPPPSTLPPQAIALVDQALAQESLCYQGRVAQRMPSLFNANGFAVSFGSSNFNDGDPLPRLEFFYDVSTQPVTVTALSMTHRDIEGFPTNHEVVVPYTSDAIAAVIARWTVAVATETCRPGSSTR